MKPLYKALLYLLCAAIMLSWFYVFYTRGVKHGYSEGYTAAHDKQQLVVNGLQAIINRGRTATITKVADVNAAATVAVKDVERVQTTKTVYRTQYVDRYKESPESAEKCLSIDSVDAINKLLELQEP